MHVWQDLTGESLPCFSSEIHRAAFAIRLPSMLFTSFAEAAGAKVGLVLSSSAQASHITHQTEVGVVTFNETG